MAPTVDLPTGAMPQLGLGTYKLHDETVREVLDTAYDAGYRHVDTAEGYGNEAALGDALASYDRDDFWITSKVLPSNLNYESVIDACQASLDRLGIDTLDLYLVHWPNPAISLRETLDAMATLVDRGLVRNVGVSNFTAYQLRAARRISPVPIAVDQVEFHPYYQQERVREEVADGSIALEAAAPLARAAVFDDPTITEIAERYDRTPAQITLRWAIEHGATVIPRSSTPDHVRANADVLDWSLDDRDVGAIDDIATRESAYYEGFDFTGETYGIAE
ncbi:aldo/keto reductase [Halococcoides cellulosivorans]|uniref:Aldo/keto reductase n=1 Tax=Halococcoides cellulosivorans TaxID=1679096 RepID=A0A2R4X208_9EURY|nr:aldo/keto reductase [Halococcoides cellulosivorans]AWB27840.1 aldo/keto reductase [Halococcoides cellulosivorans]